ncbi:MAG TPA: hypothetical protein VG253_26955 [Streptosporangiaceae bacterium]|nr:hypothetical protein [Streptosporangiaceae bacterium]
MLTSRPSRPGRKPGNAPRRKSRATVAVLLAAVLAVSGYLVVRTLGPALVGAGCRAVGRHQSVLLDTEQANIAATIAAVAHKQSMPHAAVDIAYATALQESKLHNLPYGDMDSVGVFQQRPSQGWGPRKDLLDPVYATTKFFRALAAVPRYRQMPVYKAAQAVQRSADGSAYSQYEPMAAQMTPAFTGVRAHSVYCWSSSSPAHAADLRAATRELTHAFGPVGASQANVAGSRALLLRVGTGAAGWAVAAWLVTHAAGYDIHQVRYAGYQWRASAGQRGWAHNAGEPPTGHIELS